MACKSIPQHHFNRHTVKISCADCSLTREITQLEYFKYFDDKYGEEDTLAVTEWLHTLKGGEQKVSKCMVTFTTTDGEYLGKVSLPFAAIQKLSIGDMIEFKDEPILFGKFFIERFAVNEGYPEGTITLKEYVDPKVKAKIKLSEYNQVKYDNLLPF